MDKPTKITFDEMREMGIRGVRDAGRLHAYSAHFIRGSNEVGSWSIERSTNAAMIKSLATEP
jgi:hypothetical protein